MGKGLLSIAMLAMCLSMSLVLEHDIVRQAHAVDEGEISGEIISKDVNESMIVIRHYREPAHEHIYEEKSFLVTENTKIVKDGEEVEFKDLRTRHHVQVSFYISMEVSHPVASVIVVEK